MQKVGMSNQYTIQNIVQSMNYRDIGVALARVARIAQALE